MADDEQFSLCWNNFNSNLSAGFHESLCRGDLVDVTLAAEGQLVKAHRLVLSVCSPYFRKMFTQMPANQHAFVFLKDVSHSALKDLIQFMYCGEVNVKQEALPAFISTAEALQIKGLTDSDPSPSGQPPSEPTTPTPQLPQVQTSPRTRQQRTVAATRSYKIETVDEASNDSKPQTTQIVIQTTAASVSQPTAITSYATQPASGQHHHHQQQQQQHHHIQTQHHHQQHPQQQQLQSQSHQISTVSIPSGSISNIAATTTHVVGSSHKRPAQRSSIGSVAHVKRSKTSTIDPLEGAEANGGGATQQITIQTAIVSDPKTQQHQQSETAEYIDLPLELPTKSEPDYTDETGEVDPNEQDATYVEDESYGDMRYDETYFAENEDGGGGSGVTTTGTSTTTAGNINISNATNAGNVTVGIGNATSSGGGGGVVGSAAATTSKAIIKQQQNTSFSESSYAEGTDQTNNDAQDGNESDVDNSRIRSNLPKILDGKFYNNIQPNKKTRGGIQATCTSCFSVISGTTKSTGNFLSHIKRRHKDILPNCQIYCSSRGLLNDTKLPFDHNSVLHERPTYVKKMVKLYKRKSIKANAIKIQKKKTGNGYSDEAGDSATGSGAGSIGYGHGNNDSPQSECDEDYIDEILKIKCEPTRIDSSSSNNSIATTPKFIPTAINKTTTINKPTTTISVTATTSTPLSTTERKPANGIYKKPPTSLKALK